MFPEKFPPASRLRMRRKIFNDNIIFTFPLGNWNKKNDRKLFKRYCRETLRKHSACLYIRKVNKRAVLLHRFPTLLFALPAYQFRKYLNVRRSSSLLPVGDSFNWTNKGNIRMHCQIKCELLCAFTLLFNYLN